MNLRRLFCKHTTLIPRSPATKEERGFLIYDCYDCSRRFKIDLKITEEFKYGPSPIQQHPR